MTREPLHAVTWFLWAVAAAVSVQLAPNPLYVAIVIAAAAVVVEAHGGSRPLRRAFPLLLSVGVVFAALRVVLTALTSHTGTSTVFSIPQAKLPGVFGGFFVGGSVDGDVIARAASEGLAVIGIMAAFGAFNAVVAHDELVRTAPRAFHEIGLVVMVALAFVPATVSAIASVREADKARTGGRVVRRGRLIRQILPVLETGMERAVHLAESMDARGFGHLPAAPREVVGGWLAGTGLLSVAGAFVALVGRRQTLAGALLVAGAALIVAAVVISTQGTRRVRYRPRRLSVRDRAVVAVLFVPPLLIAVASARGDASLTWPGQSLAMPSLNLLLVLALGVLALPALLPNAAGPRR